ncbi:MAG TPA: hypothetical protein VEC36_04120 [Patescibacteria group bacterium]|nr:hypothetical protein [Patescibacteria group bacterium]
MIVRIPAQTTILPSFYGDDQVTISALSVASLANGESTILGASEHDESKLLKEILESLGVEFTTIAVIAQNEKQLQNGNGKLANNSFKNVLKIRGNGLQSFKKAEAPINVSNNGILLRAITGLLVGQQHEYDITGSGQLLKRSLVRFLEPLEEMGAQFHSSYRQTLPLKIFGTHPLKNISYEAPLPTFTTKLAILLAACNAEGKTVFSEPYPSATYCEELMSTADIFKSENEYRVEISGGAPDAFEVKIPRDILLTDCEVLATILLKNSREIHDVSPAEGRGSLVEWLLKYAKGIAFKRDEKNLLKTGTLIISGNVEFENCELTGKETRRFLNALPFLAVLFAAFKKRLLVRDAIDVRQRKCDWLAAIVDGLAGFGIEPEEFDDGFEINGKEDFHGGAAICYGEESIALAFIALGAAVGDFTQLEDVPCTPRMEHLLKSLQCEVLESLP